MKKKEKKQKRIKIKLGFIFSIIFSIFLIVLVIATIPSPVLNTPPNRSIFAVGIFNITLNTTIIDSDGNTSTVRIYGRESTSIYSSDFYKHGLLYQQFGVANNTILTYNWTAPVIVPDASTVVLYHLDNNSLYGENQTKAYDFVAGKVNLTAKGNAAPNVSGGSGKFAGSWVFDGNGDYLSDASNLGALNGIDNATMSAWIKRAGNSSNGYETIIQEGGAGGTPRGYAMTANCNDSTIYFGLREGGVFYSANASNSLITDGNWHFLTGVYDGDADLVSLYVDGNLMNSSVVSVDEGNPTRGVRVGGHESGVSGTLCSASTTTASFNGSIDEVGIWNRSMTASEVLDLYRLKANEYSWKVNVTDSDGNNNESVRRKFYVGSPLTQLTPKDNIDCADLLLDVTGYGYGSSCTMAGYSTCINLNATLNLSFGSILTVPSTCNIRFNITTNGVHSFIIQNGSLNMSGGNITSSNSTGRFNFISSVGVVNYQGSYGNFSLANIQGGTNFSDSKINFYGLNITGKMRLLNSSDIATTGYSIASGGRLDRQWRLKVTVLASGSSVSGANVTARNVSLAIIDNKLTGSDGIAWFNLSEWTDTGGGKIGQNNYTLNATKAGYFSNWTTINLSADSGTSLNIKVYDTIEVSSTETLHDIFTRIGNSQVFNNLSSGARPCRYVSTASINITSNGNLVMESCTLEMNNTDATGGSGIYDLIVGGGRLTANYSNITWSQSYNYDFYTASSTGTQVILKNSFVSFANSYLMINTNNITTYNTTFIKVGNGILISANNIILNSINVLGQGVTDYAIETNANNISIVDSNLSGSSFSDIRLRNNTSIFVINTNYTNEQSSSSGSSKKLYKQWYITLNLTNNSGSGLAGNIYFYNVSGTLLNTITTNESGFGIANITEYVSNGTTRFNQNNYTITARKAGYYDTSISFNVTTNSLISLNTSIDPCAYSGGNWNLNCSLNCNINSNIIIDSGYNFTLIGFGNTTISANVTGFKSFFMSGFSSTQKCRATLINGARFGSL